MAIGKQETVQPPPFLEQVALIRRALLAQRNYDTTAAEAALDAMLTMAQDLPRVFQYHYRHEYLHKTKEV